MKVRMFLFIFLLLLAPYHVLSLSQPLGQELDNFRCGQLMKNLANLPKVAIINEAINVCDENDVWEIIDGLIEEAKEHCEEFQSPNKMAHCFKKLWKFKMNILDRMNYQNIGQTLSLVH